MFVGENLLHRRFYVPLTKKVPNFQSEFIVTYNKKTIVDFVEKQNNSFIKQLEKE